MFAYLVNGDAHIHEHLQGAKWVKNLSAKTITTTNRCLITSKRKCKCKCKCICSSITVFMSTADMCDTQPIINNWIITMPQTPLEKFPSKRIDDEWGVSILHQINTFMLIATRYQQYLFLFVALWIVAIRNCIKRVGEIFAAHWNVTSV